MVHIKPSHSVNVRSHSFDDSYLATGLGALGLFDRVKKPKLVFSHSTKKML